MDTNRDRLALLIASNALPDASEMELLQYEMAILKTELTSLRRRTEEAEKLLLQCQAAAAPIRRVPLEIIGEVLVFALPKFMDAEGRAVLVNYALVCKTWRIASLLKNELWSRVRIGLDISFPLRYEAVSSWCDRSGNLPRALELRDDHWVRCPGKECLWSDPTVTQLLSDGPAIHRLSLISIDLHCLRHLLAAVDRQPEGESLPCKWRRITQLDILFNAIQNRSQHIESPQSLLRRLPPVSSLRLSFPHFEESFALGGTMGPASALGIPTTILEGVSRLKWSSGWSGSSLLHTLNGCPHLTHLTFDCRSPSGFTLSLGEGSVITLAKLRALRLQNIRKSVPILKFLITPALKILDIGFGVHYEDGDSSDDSQTRREEVIELRPGLAQKFLGFLKKRSKCQRTLKVLRFFRCKDPHNQIGSIVTKLRALKELTLDMVIEHPDLWTTLSDHTRGGASKFPTCLKIIQLLSRDSTKPSIQHDQSLFQFLQVLHDVKPLRKGRRGLFMSFQSLDYRHSYELCGMDAVSEEEWIGNLRLMSGDAATREALTDLGIFLAFRPNYKPSDAWVDEYFEDEDPWSESGGSDTSWSTILTGTSE